MAQHRLQAVWSADAGAGRSRGLENKLLNHCLKFRSFTGAEGHGGLPARARVYRDNRKRLPLQKNSRATGFSALHRTSRR
jgi:hypothetical protein